MITNKPNHSPLHNAIQRGTPYDKANEAIDMVLGILGVLRCAIDPDAACQTVSAGHLLRAVEAALFLAEEVQDEINTWHTKSLLQNDEVPHERIS
ncbi:MAG: hypothetical protein PHI97_08935 [Desulfobulbus sp.]|nr:hypothetical protein [Desulfobulbus sp.]